VTKVAFGSCWVTKTNVMKVLLPMVNLENNPYINNKEFTAEKFTLVLKKKKSYGQHKNPVESLLLRYL